MESIGNLMRKTSWLESWHADLRPAPGRTKYALKIALSSIVAVIFLMVLQAPFAAYAAYVILQLGFQSPAATLKIGVALMLAIVSTLGIALMVIIVTDNNPMVRILSLAIVIFIAAMCTVATSLPAIGSGVGQVFFLAISFWENQVPSDRLVKNTLWLVGSFGVAIGTAIAIEYIFGSASPGQLLYEQLCARYKALSAFFASVAEKQPLEDRAAAAAQLSLLASQGNQPMLDLYRRMNKRDQALKLLGHDPLRNVLVIGEMLDHASAISFHVENTDDRVRRHCERLARRFAQLAADLQSVGDGFSPPEADRADSSRGNFDELDRLLLSLDEDREGAITPLPAKLPQPKKPFLLPGALTDPQNIYFSMKISLCATFCYILFHAIDWPGINTSVITVIVAGLAHTGEMKQKLTFRIIGGIIGGLVIGMGSVVFLFPLADSITSLCILIGVVSFISAWASAGPRFSYIGLQVAFAFYVTILGGFSAPTALAPARDRLAGILLACFVLWLVMDQIWPVRTITAMRKIFISLLKDTARITMLVDEASAGHNVDSEQQSLRANLRQQIGSLRTLQYATMYEFGQGYDDTVKNGHAILGFSTALIGLAWNQAVLLHTDEEGEVGKDMASRRLRESLAQQLCLVASAMETKSPLNVKESDKGLDADLLNDLPNNDYVRNTLMQYGELRHWAALLETEG